MLPATVSTIPTIAEMEPSPGTAIGALESDKLFAAQADPGLLVAGRYVSNHAPDNRATSSIAPDSSNRWVSARNDGQPVLTIEMGGRYPIELEYARDPPRPR